MNLLYFKAMNGVQTTIITMFLFLLQSLVVTDQCDHTIPDGWECLYQDQLRCP